MATTNDKTRITTGKVRFSYVHVFEPTAMDDNQQKKYSVSLLIPKKDKSGIAKIEAAIEAALQQGIEKIWKGKKPSKLMMPLNDGDDEKGESNPEYRGQLYINAKCIRKPNVFDADREEIIDPDEFYSGCYGRASITFYAYDKNGNKGVACGLNGVQKLEDGESLSGGAATADEFEDDDDLM